MPFFQKEERLKEERSQKRRKRGLKKKGLQKRRTKCLEKKGLKEIEKESKVQRRKHV